MSPIQSPSLTPIAPSLPEPASGKTGDPVSSAFSNLLNETFSAEASAQQAIQTSLLGGNITQAEVLSAVKKADLSVRMLMGVRNKIIDALNEIQQMRF